MEQWVGMDISASNCLRLHYEGQWEGGMSGRGDESKRPLQKQKIVWKCLVSTCHLPKRVVLHCRPTPRVQTITVSL